MSANNQSKNKESYRAPLLRPAEVADILGTTTAHVRNMFAAGVLPFVEVSMRGSIHHHRRVVPRVLDRFISERAANSML